MKDAYYFSHDANARHDPKIVAMMRVWKDKGYGRYWVIIESLRETDTEHYQLPHKPYIYEALAEDAHCTPASMQDFIKDCIERTELLTSDGEHFWSDSLRRRMAQREALSEARAAAGKLGAEAKWRQTDGKAMAKDGKPMAKDGNRMALKERKGKERKRKEMVPSAPVSENDAPAPPTVTPLMEKCFPLLKSVACYPFDEVKDVEMIAGLVEEFPQVNIFAELRAWKRYKFDHPLEAKSSPRSQIGNWMKKAEPAGEQEQSEPFTYTIKTKEEQDAEYEAEMRRLAAGCSPSPKSGS
jgi:hypothetical protein